MVVLCYIVVVTGFLPFPVSRSSLSSPPSQVRVLKFCPVLGFSRKIPAEKIPGSMPAAHPTYLA